MAVPTLEVSIAFNDGPYVWSPTWTDVTAYVRQVNIFRGRQDDFSEFDTATASVVLDNNDRRFDPFNTSGPYYGKLKPRRQLRIRGTIGGNTYDIYRGFVTGFPVVRSSTSNDSTVTVSCVDILGIATTTNIKASLADNWFSQNVPTVANWRNSYKFSDPDKSAVIVDRRAGNNLALLSGELGRSNPPLAYGLFDRSFDMTNGTYQMLPRGVTGESFSYFAVSFWAMLPIKNNASYQVFKMTFDQGQELTFFANTLYGAFNQAGYVTTTLLGDTGLGKATDSTITNLTGSVAHHFVFYVNNLGAQRLYIDGEDKGNTQSIGVGVPSTPKGPFTITSIGNAVIQNFDVVVNTAFTAQQIKDLYDYGNGFKMATTSARLEELRLLFGSEITTDWVNFHTSADSLGSILDLPERNSSLIDNWKQVMLTEGGFIFTLPNGKIKTTGRQYMATTASSYTAQATFADNGTGLGYLGDIQFSYDQEDLRNDIAVTYGGGNQYHAEDATSITTVGRHSMSVDSASSSLDEAIELGNWLLGFDKREVPKLTAFEVGLPATTTSDWQTLLQLDLLKMVTFINTPPTGSVFSQNLLINAIQFELTPKKWSMVILGSARYSDLFFLNSSLLDGTNVLA